MSRGYTPTEPREGKFTVLGCFFLGLAMFAVFVVGFLFIGWLLMTVWNVVAPIFNGPTLDYGQALALYVIILIIGGAFRKAT